MRLALGALGLAAMVLLAPAAPYAAEEAKPEVQDTKKFVKATYDYKVEGRRDPFLSIITTLKARPDKPKGIVPVEDYDLSQMKLKAIVRDRANSYALIILPDGKAYTITEGMTLGLHGGKIVKIQEESVLVREIKPDYRGVSRPQDVFLRLR